MRGVLSRSKAEMKNELKLTMQDRILERRKGLDPPLPTALYLLPELDPLSPTFVVTSVRISRFPATCDITLLKR